MQAQEQQSAQPEEPKRLGAADVAHCLSQTPWKVSGLGIRKQTYY
jgi:hypothetical protein